jgi:ethylbenzene dioxygenase subunit beta
MNQLSTPLPLPPSLSAPPSSPPRFRATSAVECIRFPSPVLVSEVEQFLFAEARLLDEERYQEWLALLTDDVHYRVPGVDYRRRRDFAGAARPDAMAYFDDTKDLLALRVQRLVDETAWSEDPPTRHLHLVSNIEVAPAGTPGELLVHSAFVNHRCQRDTDQAVAYGRREDILRRSDDGGLRIARRTVRLQHATLPAKNINTFF